MSIAAVSPENSTDSGRPQVGMEKFTDFSAQQKADQRSIVFSKPPVQRKMRLIAINP